ncbi:hypothetical protein [Xanthomonas sacchari]|uniref:hypothetical protein n=1 Tax=Xanthomonas sacchari TaxID=56458 RepID=UPI00225C25E2|nr:hypothetical protein [Xanthomonas sacchari]UYK72822.1 hypothetical protein NG828_00245 [Xanthomonas sacchari]
MKAISRIILAITALFLVVVLRQVSVIHGDGPGGFGELLLKGLLAQVSILCFALLIVCLRRVSRDVAAPRLSMFGVYLTTAVITFSFAVSLFDACADEKGYCRNWEIVLAHRSLEPDPVSKKMGSGSIKSESDNM